MPTAHICVAYMVKKKKGIQLLILRVKKEPVEVAQTSDRDASRVPSLGASLGKLSWWETPM